jgi:transcription antitermination protein NusB
MGKRRSGRILAVQFLYQRDAGAANDDWEADWREFLTLADHDQASKEFALPRIRGVLQHLEALNELLKRYGTNWDPSRMAAVDRAIMRLALYEMLHCPDVPPVVAINEAIEIAKQFSTDDSGRFVNGLLDRVRKENAPAAPEKKS